LLFVNILLNKYMKIINKYRVLIILNKCKKVGEEVNLRMPVKIYSPGKLSLGNKVSIGEYTHIRAEGGITIGNRVLIASHVIITSQGHPKSLPRYGITLDKPINIEDDVWISANAVVLCPFGKREQEKKLSRMAAMPDSGVAWQFV